MASEKITNYGALTMGEVREYVTVNSLQHFALLDQDGERWDVRSPGFWDAVGDDTVPIDDFGRPLELISIQPRRVYLAVPVTNETGEEWYEQAEKETGARFSFQGHRPFKVPYGHPRYGMQLAQFYATCEDDDQAARVLAYCERMGWPAFEDSDEGIEKAGA